MSYLGLDVGTSGCKAVVFDERGEQRALSYREYPVRHSQGSWAELDAEQVSAACKAVVAEAAAAVAGDPVQALAISSQGEAFTPVDAAGRMLAPAMVSSDSRAAALAESWTAAFGAERLYRITGHTPHPMHTLFKLLWTRDHRRDAWERARRFLCFEDLVQAQFGLEPHMSWPLAGRTLLFDVSSHTWSPEILEAVGLEPSRLAKPVPSGTCVGTLDARTAAAWGLLGGVMIVAGGHDQMCAALGAGVVAAGQAAYATGTTECITVLFPQPIFNGELRASNLCTYDTVLSGKYGTVAFCLTGGNILQWFRDQFGAAERAAAAETGQNAYQLLLEQVPDEPSGLLVLPYFAPGGTPYFDMTTPGVVYGLRLSTSRGEFLRALLEGVLMEMRVNTEILARSGVAIREFRASGGGTRSARWNQLKADVLGVPITTISTAEAGCCGAALLAAAARLGATVEQLAAAWVRPRATFEPDAARHARYREQFARYQRLYEAARALR
jgi:xylulokinase